MNINAPNDFITRKFEAIPTEYYNIMKSLANEFARRSNLNIDWTTGTVGVINPSYTLNGPLRTSVAWRTAEFFPDDFDVNNADQTTLTAEQANFIIAKLLEICDIGGITYDHNITKSGSRDNYSYTAINSVLSDAKYAGVIPQFFEKQLLESIILNLSLESYTSQTSSCRSACTGLCVNFCGTSCTGICGGSCTGSCIGQCTGSCFSTCKSSCGVSCSANCSGGCGNQCQSACNDMCNTTCADACSSECTGICKTSCTGTCTKSCTEECAKSCNDACISQCLGTCNDTCTSGCSDGCSAQCGSTCSQQCTLNCAETCTTTCEDICNSTCGNSCMDGCGKACGTTCTGACDGAADAYHSIDNTYADPDHRD